MHNMHIAKIFHIITRLDKGGSAENAIITCRSLNSDRFHSLLIYGSTVAPALALNIPAVQVPLLVREISPFKDIIALIHIFFLLWKETPHIIHTNSSKGGFIGRWAGFFYNISRRFLFKKRVCIVHTPHGHVFYGYEFSQLKTKLFILLEQLTAPITDILIALTEGERDESLERGIGKPVQWRIVHCAVGIYGEQFKTADVHTEFGIPSDALIIGTTARFEPVKGVRYLIDAFSLMKDMEFDVPVYLLLVGDGALRNELQLLAEKYEVSERVIFTGMRQDVVPLMAAMDVYVQPSLNEGLGKTIIQAQAAGVPIVASRVQGIPSAIKENVTVLLVPPHNPHALAQAILRLLQNGELRTTMGNAGTAWVHELVDGFPRFSTERMIYLLEQLYNEAVQ